MEEMADSLTALPSASYRTMLMISAVQEANNVRFHNKKTTHLLLL
jgi:hypothetical protein